MLIEIITLPFVLGCAVLVASRKRPIEGFCVYCVGTLCYPQISLPIGSVDFSPSRILILVFMAKCIGTDRIRRQFKWQTLDTLVLLYFFLKSFSLFMTEDFMMVLVRRGGHFIEFVLPYLGARMALRSRADWFSLIKGFVGIGIFLGILGVYQSVTWRDPLGVLYGQGLFGMKAADDRLIRYGLYRATVTFSQFIAFGMYFAAVLPLSFSLLKGRVYSLPRFFVNGALLFGGLVSSVSSGPLFSLIVALSTLAGFRLRFFWRPMTGLLVIVCIMLELLSNRHFYEIPTRFAFSGKNAAYRIGLYNEAFGGGMTGHWLFGYGFVGVSADADNTNFHWVHKDFTSFTIGTLATTGLVGLIPQLAMTVGYYVALYRAARRTRRKEDMWHIWCLTAALVGWTIGTLTVSLVAQMLMVLPILMAMAGNASLVFSPEPLAQQMPERQAYRMSLMGQRKARIEHHAR